MNLRIVFKFKNYKLQFYEKRRSFCYFSVNPCMPACRWRRLLKLNEKKNSFKIIIGFFLFIARQKLSNALKSLKAKKSLQESNNRASERASE